MRLLLPVLLLVPLSAAPVLADAPEDETPRIYRWVDENGVAHYTTDENRIPASLRRRFGVPTRPLEHTPLEADAPESVLPAAAPVAPEAWAAQERSDEPPTPAPPEMPEETAEPEAPGVSAGLASDAERLDSDADALGPEPDRLARVELRIAELSAAIAADEDMLSAWLADPESKDVVALSETPHFREVAARLPKRIQELEALVSERDALAAATP